MNKTNSSHQLINQTWAFNEMNNSHIYSVFFIIYFRVFTYKDGIVIFFKNVSSNSKFCVQGVFQVGVDTHIGMSSAKFRCFVKSSLKMIVPVRENLRGEPTNRCSISYISKQTQKIAIIEN